MDVRKVAYHMQKTAGMEKEARGGGGSAGHLAQMRADRMRRRESTGAGQASGRSFWPFGRKQQAAPAPSAPKLDMGGFTGPGGERYDDMGMRITADGKYMDEQPVARQSMAAIRQGVVNDLRKAHAEQVANPPSQGRVPDWEYYTNPANQAPSAAGDNFKTYAGNTRNTFGYDPSSVYGALSETQQPLRLPTNQSAFNEFRRGMMSDHANKEGTYGHGWGRPAVQPESPAEQGVIRMADGTGVRPTGQYLMPSWWSKLPK